MSSNIRIKKICVFCKNEFTARTTKTLYCSLKCNSKAYKSKVRQLKLGEFEEPEKKAEKQAFEAIQTREYIDVHMTSQLIGISKRTVYRLIERGELNIAKFGTRTIIRRSDLDNFFSIPLEESMLRPVQEFPGLEKCYNITQIQQKFKISNGALYMLIQRHGITKYTVGRFTYVAKKDIDILFNARDYEKD